MISFNYNNLNMVNGHTPISCNILTTCLKLGRSPEVSRLSLSLRFQGCLCATLSLSSLRRFSIGLRSVTSLLPLPPKDTLLPPPPVNPPVESFDVGFQPQSALGFHFCNHLAGNLVDSLSASGLGCQTQQPSSLSPIFSAFASTFFWFHGLVLFHILHSPCIPHVADPCLSHHCWCAFPSETAQDCPCFFTFPLFHPFSCSLSGEELFHQFSFGVCSVWAAVLQQMLPLYNSCLA